jgi:hypothetical protein
VYVYVPRVEGLRSSEQWQPLASQKTKKTL